MTDCGFSSCKNVLKMGPTSVKGLPSVTEVLISYVVFVISSDQRENIVSVLIQIIHFRNCYSCVSLRRHHRRYIQSIQKIIVPSIKVRRRDQRK